MTGQQGKGIRKLFVLGAVALALVCGLCVIAGSLARVGRTGPVLGAGSTEAAGASAPAAGQGAEVVSEEAPKTFDFALNERFRLGDCEIVVTSARTMTTIGRNRYLRTTAPQGATYLVVRYSETNVGNESISGLANGLEVVTPEGTTYRPSSVATSRLAIQEEADFIISELHPGVRHDGAVAFELPVAKAGPATNAIVFHERGLLGRGQSRVALAERGLAEAMAVMTALRDGAPGGDLVSGRTPEERRALTTEYVGKCQTSLAQYDREYDRMHDWVEEALVGRQAGTYVGTISVHPRSRQFDPAQDPHVRVTARYWHGAYRLLRCEGFNLGAETQPRRSVQ